MNTFLPYPDFTASARCLDRARLGKQRDEVVQILLAIIGESVGWQYHPAVRMWEANPRCLIRYGEAVCEEWIRRGYQDNQRFILRSLCFNPAINASPASAEPPKWLGDGRVHAAYRATLLFKDFVHYSKFGWTENPAYGYRWELCTNG